MRTRLLITALCAAWLGCNEATAPEPPPEITPWSPGVALRSDPIVRRGLVDLRGVIHAHSVHSHDACDGNPKPNDVPDPICLADFRSGVCQSAHDFVMLTDHTASFADVSLREALLIDEGQGDQPLVRAGLTVANRLGCPDGPGALLLAGFESGTMSVGLEAHVSTSAADRRRIYGSERAIELEQTRDAGAVVLLQHTEDWTATQLARMPVDGFEMFNLHANALQNALAILELLIRVQDDLPGLPHPDLAFVPVISEDPRYLERWNDALELGVRRVTVMGSDVHRNTFTAILADGERVDSYRRMMGFFSNHLLVRARDTGDFTDRDLKDALRSGRLYGAFEMLGHPGGFDFFADSTDGLVEMGSLVPLSSRPELVVKRPVVRALDPSRTAPTIVARILKSSPEGWQEVIAAEGDLVYRPTASGAYRAEIRITPRHLAEDLGDFGRRAEAGTMPWIYANPIYVR